MISSWLVVPEWTTWEGKLFYGIIGFSWAAYVWEEYIAYRQRKVYFANENPPKELKEIIDKETFTKARLYSIDKSSFGFVKEAYSQVFSTGLMLCGAFPALWNVSGQFVQWLGYAGSSEIPQTVAFVFIGSLITSVLDLPWSAYYTFKIEQKHGFNKETPAFFIMDNIKKFIVSQIISAPVVSGIVYIIKIGGDYFFMYLWGFAMVVVFLLMTVYPDYIAPLFDKYELLQDGELKTQIENLAAQINFPLKKIYVVEGSKRSAHSNAYLYGFLNNKRIVLYDTLLEDYTPLNKPAVDEKSEGEEVEEDTQESATLSTTKKKTGCSTEEVIAVLGHELGHWKLNHVPKGIIISQVNLFMVFGVFGSLYQYAPLYRAFGFHHSQPAFIGLILVTQFVFAPYNEILGFFLVMFSRYHEFQADGFAKKLGYADKLKAALIKLNLDNLGFPVYDWLYSSWHHSHPPLLQRIRAIDTEKKKED